MTHSQPPFPRWIRATLATLLSLASSLPAVAGGGSGQGLSPVGNFVIPTPTNIPSALAFGDFNGDGRPDLAVGTPDGLGGDSTVNRVDVFLSDGVGLFLAATYFGNFASATGSSLAAGDFDGDGTRDEIAVGAPFETVASQYAAGRVLILALNGSSLTLVASFTQGMPLIGETPEAGDHFGWSLASGDFNNDGSSDLAIGVPDEDRPGAADVGLVHVLYGNTGGGLGTLGAQQWSQGSAGDAVAGVAAANDQFGYALAAGDFDGDLLDDLAIGVPGEPAGSVADAGGVQILYGGGSAGLAAAGNQIWVVGSAGVTGFPQSGSAFGSSLSACDFDGDGWTDLAVGAPFADVFGVVAAAGLVYELHGGPTGITGSGSRDWTASDLPGSAANPDDVFGFSLACGSFDGGNQADLAVASPRAQVDGLFFVGAVDVIPGSPGGLTAYGAQRFSPNGLASGPAAANQVFGEQLAAGDFDGNGHADLAVSLAKQSVVQIIRGDSDVLFFDRFETGDTQKWSAKVP